MRKVVGDLIKFIIECYSSRNIAWQLLMPVITLLAVMTGFDWYYFTNTRDPLLQAWLFPAAVVGGLLPILLPAALFAVGKLYKNARASATAWAVTHAGLIGLLLSSFYKMFTGRIPPPFRSAALVDNSHEFNFGILREGAFWGWPSSHTTTAFAIAVTIFILYRHKPLIAYSALAVALYIGLGVSTNIHWFSEFASGIVLGSVVGAVVGTAFRSAAQTPGA